jgi:enamine deaminase RidA (YjgF/YER057c/UK114 family)
MSHTIVNPPTLAPPRGYSNGLVYPPGALLFVAGQIGWNAQGELVSSYFSVQFAQALDNVLAVVHAAGGRPDQIARLTIYVTNKQRYSDARADVGQRYRERMGEHYPTMTLVEVKDLLEPGAQVEIEATAVIS